MPRSSPMARMAGSETQPSCFWTSHRIGITAEARRFSGYLLIHQSALAFVAFEKANEAGCSLARRRTLIRFPVPGRRRGRRSSSCAAAGSPVDLAEHDVERAEDGRDVGQH